MKYARNHILHPNNIHNWADVRIRQMLQNLIFRALLESGALERKKPDAGVS